MANRLRSGIIVARVAWAGLVLFGSGILIAAFPALPQTGFISSQAYQELAQLGLTDIVTETLLAHTAKVLAVLLLASFIGAAMVVFWRRSDDRAAIVMSATLFAVGVTNGVITDHPDPSPLFRMFEVLTDVLSLLVLYTFPDGRFTPRWAAVLLIPWLGVLAANQIEILPGAATEDILDVIFLGTGILAQTYRYRRVATPEQQQQTKWVVLGIATIVSVIYLTELARFALPIFFKPSSLGYLAYGVARAFIRTFIQLLLPLVFVFSILRYRLWDIDFYINRSLVYGSLTVVLGLVFFGSALLFQEGARAVFGDARSTLVLTASAVFIAILFQPARQRLQSFVDRRFYGIRPLSLPEPVPESVPARALVEPLSAREMDVLSLIDAGLSNRDIAEELFLTVGTVKWHTNNIYTKLGVNSRTQALVQARDLNLLH